jgi:mitogen-activated protein kinase 1/3
MWNQVSHVIIIMHYNISNGQSTRVRYRARPASFDWNVGHSYEIICLQGNGTYGTVCLARHIPTGEMVAIKRICNIFQDVHESKRLLREIAILDTLSHPNIVRVLEIIKPSDLETFDEIYIVFEAVAGDLKKLIRSNYYLDESHIQLIVYNMLCAVKYIHSANILHRDLKPANILINENCEIKICDFGLARGLPDDFIEGMDVDFESGNYNANPRTQSLPICSNKLLDISPDTLLPRPKTITLKRRLSGHVVTRWYRPPELIIREREYNKPIDVWSLACIIAELCSMQKGNALTIFDRAPLFPGQSCFPDSPDMKVRERRAGFPSSETDQLNVIFDVIGTPKEEETNFITDERAKIYVKSFRPRERKNLREMYPATHPALIQMMEQMLRFDPNDRITCDDALRSPYFDSIRNSQVEFEAALPAFFDFEDEEFSIPKLRKYFIREINKYQL